jgi:hypothetical protein
MGRRLIGDKPLSVAERQERHREKRAAELAERIVGRLARRVSALDREVSRLRREVERTDG